MKNSLFKNLLPYLIILSGLFFAGFVSVLLVSHTESKKTDFLENKVQGVTTDVSAVSPSPEPTVLTATKPIIKTVAHLNPSPTPTYNSKPTLMNGFKSTALPVAGIFVLLTAFKFLEGRRWRN